MFTPRQLSVRYIEKTGGRMILRPSQLNVNQRQYNKKGRIGGCRLRESQLETNREDRKRVAKLASLQLHMDCA